MSNLITKATMSIPASVLTYFNDRPTKMAIDLLLTKKRPSVPEDVKWDELVSFYKAGLAAKQVETELAVLLCEVWAEVCRDMPPAWIGQQPHEQKKDCATDVAQVWEECCHTREYLKGDLSCEICVCIGKDVGFQVGYGLWQDGETLLGQSSPLGWEPPDEMCWSPEEAVPLDETINLANLRDLAEEGRTFIMKVVEEHEAQID